MEHTSCSVVTVDNVGFNLTVVEKTGLIELFRNSEDFQKLDQRSLGIRRVTWKTYILFLLFLDEQRIRAPRNVTNKKPFAKH